jgi:hypothetical protein
MEMTSTESEGSSMDVDEYIPVSPEVTFDQLPESGDEQVHNVISEFLKRPKE